MRLTYGGKVFDVLGEAFTETPLRTLLLEAIQYGERADVKAKMHEVIDASIGDGLKELLEERALASEDLAEADLATAARGHGRGPRPPAPAALHRAGLQGRLHPDSAGGSPSARRAATRSPTCPSTSAPPVTARSPPATTASLSTSRTSRWTTCARADLLAPGHPLHDAVMDEAVRQFGAALNRGTVLVSATLEEPHLLVGVIEEVADATGESVARRFGYAFVDGYGTVSPAGPAPYLDCVAAPAGPAATAARALPWLAEAEDRATSWIIANQLPEYLAEVQPRRLADLTKARDLVTKRLTGESERLLFEAAIASEKEQKGERPRSPPRA